MMTNTTQRILTFGVLLVLFIILYHLPPLFLSLVLTCIIADILRYEWPQLCPGSGYAQYLITVFYPILPFMFMIYMNEYYHNLFMAMLIIVASFDTGAYVVGSRWGTHPLFPRISPGKTWEGVGGGLLFAGTVLCLLSHYYQLFYSPLFLVAATLILCTAALIGDLLESWLKRRAGIKDSAQLLPGHGGLLDRFDSHMIAVFVVYAARNYFFK